MATSGGYGSRRESRLGAAFAPRPAGSRARGWLAAAALLLALLACPAAADVLHLKDGRRVEGEILTEDEEEVTIKTPTGKFRVFARSEIEKIYREDKDEPDVKGGKGAKPGAPGKKAVEEPEQKGGDDVDKATRRYERLYGAKLNVAVHGSVVVRGDMSLKDLGKIASSAQRTIDHFLKTYKIKNVDVVPRGLRRGYRWRIEIFQFKLEKGYLQFVDRVLKSIRDETMGDDRIALLRRQKGFWMLSPHALMAQYQGAGQLITSVSNVSHKTSHILLLLYKQSGTWRPWWMLEGLATWQEIRTTGGSYTYCLEVAKAGDYVRPGTPEADEAAKSKTEKLWQVRVRKMVKGREERDLGVLGRRSLNELVFEDVLQSWSVVDWLKKNGVLRSFTLAYKRERDLDKAFDDVLEVPVAGAHEMWRAWVLKTYPKK